MKKNRLAIIGAVFSIPALLIIIPGVAQGLLGLHQLNDFLDSLYAQASFLKLLIHPILVIGGLLTAFVLNAAVVFKMKFIPEDGTVIAVVQTRNKLLNLASASISACMLILLFAYSIVENFQIVQR